MESNGQTTTRRWEHWAFDFDLADSRAYFTAIDPDDAAPKQPGWEARTRSSWVGGFIGCHDARLQTLFGEFAPARLWPARFDIRLNLSLKCNGLAQCGGPIIELPNNGVFSSKL